MPVKHGQQQRGIKVDNVEITEQEMLAIRTMSDFDLTMLISEIHDHGWDKGRELIKYILESDREPTNG